MIDLPEGKFKVILADPPWSFRTFSKKGQGRSAERHYQTMSLQDIKDMPVNALADDDCVLLIWATGPCLDQAMDVIRAWGFEYKTLGFVWMKQRRKAAPLFTEQRDIFTGMGYWTRSNAEICILATKGHPKRKSASVAQAILSPLREHSRKPDEAYGRIEELLEGPYCDLFSRQKRKGWISWGNELDRFPEKT